MKELYFAGECKITFTEDWSLESKLEEAKASIIDRLKSKEMRSALSEGWRLPEKLYGFVMHTTSDGIEVVWRVWRTSELLKG